MQALKIKFEISKVENYDLDFVAKIEESKKQIAEGNFTEVKADNIKSFIDSLWVATSSKISQLSSPYLQLISPHSSIPSHHLSDKYKIVGIE